MSLEENRPSGNPGDVAPRIVVLAAPWPEVDLWWCSLETTPSLLQMLEGYLSRAELARASRFGHSRLRDRYVMGRRSLRSIIGGELGLDPGSVENVRGTRGRPQLAGKPPPLDFNISHTDGVAIVGVVQHARIGVDIERIDRVINVAGIARKFLTANERSELAGHAPDDARRRVLTLWTCKEAMSKATGDALSAPFATLDIDLRDGRTLRNGTGLYQPVNWSLHSAAVPSDYVATVAVWHPR